MVDMNAPAIADRQHEGDVAIESAYPRAIAHDIYAGAWREGMSINDFLVGIATGLVDPCERIGRHPSRFPTTIRVHYPRPIAERIHAAAQRKGLSVDDFLARLAMGRAGLVQEDPATRSQRISAPLRAEDARRAREVGEAEAAVIASLGNLDNYDLPPAQRRVAEARLANPGLSYRQLGESLGMTKDAFAGLMRRFWERAEKAVPLSDAATRPEGRRLRPTVGPRAARARRGESRILLVSPAGCVSYCGRVIYVGHRGKKLRVTVTEPQPDHVVVTDSATGAVLNELELGPVGTYHGNGRKRGRPSKAAQLANAREIPGAVANVQPLSRCGEVA